MYSLLFIIDFLGCGGAERITVQLCNHLHELGHNVTLATLNGKHNKIPIPTCNYIDLCFDEKFSNGKMWKDKKLKQHELINLNKVLTDLNPDLIVTGYNNGHWLKPYLTGNVWHWIHGELIEKRYPKNILYAVKEYFRQIRHTNSFISLFNNTKIITVNNDLMFKYQRLQPNTVIKTIHNGIDIKNIQNLKLNLEKKWKVIFLGRLETIKQPSHAIIAFAKSGVEGRMCVVGTGSQLNELIQLTYEYKVSDRVDFIGWVDNPLDYLAQSEILISCSREEAYGLVITEAIAIGVKILAYNCSSGIEYQLNAVGAKNAIINPNNIEELSTNLLQISENQADIYTNVEQLSINHMADKFLRLIHMSD